MSTVEHTPSGPRTRADRPDTSGEDGSDAKATVQQQAGRVTEEVREQAVGLAEDARDQLHKQAQVQTEHLGETLGGVADHLHALADGRPDESGQARELLERTADQLSTISQRVDELGFDGAVDELQRFARRRPGVFLASAAAIGFAGSRLTQGAKADRDGASESENGSASTPRSEERPTANPVGMPAEPLPRAPGPPPATPSGTTPGRTSGPSAQEGGR